MAKAARAVKSKSGKALLKKRDEQIEGGFGHVPDCAGLRRTTLRGRINNTKRYLCGIPAFNLSFVIRELTGRGTPRQAAAARAAFLAFYNILWKLAAEILHPLPRKTLFPDTSQNSLRRFPIFSYK